MVQPPSETAARLKLALDLHEAGVSVMRTRLRREHPDVHDDVIDGLLARWLQTRPGAEHGDADGLPKPWPRE